MDQRVTGSIPSRAHAWAAGWVPRRGRVRGNYTGMFLSLSFFLPSPLSKKKVLKVLKNKTNKIKTQNNFLKSVIFRVNKSVKSHTPDTRRKPLSPWPCAVLSELHQCHLTTDPESKFKDAADTPGRPPAASQTLRAGRAHVCVRPGQVRRLRCSRVLAHGSDRWKDRGVTGHTLRSQVNKTQTKEQERVQEA